LLRASTANMLDRALDVAAALEVRGYGGTSPPSRRRPYSRHDLAFAASAVSLLALAIASRLPGVAEFRAYPSLVCPVGLGTVALALALPAVVLLPFLDRRGVA
jgi:energy-coupling factor transport system permease protein